MSLARTLSLLFIGLFCNVVHAQVNTARFNNLRVVDNPAAAGQQLVARILYDGCPADEAPGATQVVLQGSVVTMTIPMVATPNIICFSPPPPPTDENFALGSFYPGTYTLIVQPVSALPGVSYPALTAPFVVGAANSIPTLSPLGIVGMLLALSGFAWWRFRVD